jgi:hypothetical protein
VEDFYIGYSNKNDVANLIASAGVPHGKINSYDPINAVAIKV